MRYHPAFHACAAVAITAGAWATPSYAQQGPAVGHTSTVYANDGHWENVPPRLRAGDKLEIVVVGVNSTICEIEILKNVIPASSELGHPFREGGPSWASTPGEPLQAAAPDGPLFELSLEQVILRWEKDPPSDALFKSIAIAQGNFLSGRTDDPKPDRDDLDSVIRAIATDVNTIAGQAVLRTRTEVNEAYIDKITNALLNLAENNENHKTAVRTEMDKVRRIYLAGTSQDYTIRETIEVPAGAGMHITVKIKPRAVFTDDQGPIEGYAPAESGLEEKMTQPAYIVLEGETAQRFSSAIFFTRVRDASYGTDPYTVNAGTPDEVTKYVVNREPGDSVNFFLGALYHYALDESWGWENFDLSMGLGTNGSKLLYFAGLSYRFGDDDAPGYISLGISAAHVERLDGKVAGEYLDDPSDLQTHQVLRVGPCLSLSLFF